MREINPSPTRKVKSVPIASHVISSPRLCTLPCSCLCSPPKYIGWIGWTLIETFERREIEMTCVGCVFCIFDCKEQNKTKKERAMHGRGGESGAECQIRRLTPPFFLIFFFYLKNFVERGRNHTRKAADQWIQDRQGMSMVGSSRSHVISPTPDLHCQSVADEQRCSSSLESCSAVIPDLISQQHIFPS